MLAQTANALAPATCLFIKPPSPRSTAEMCRSAPAATAQTDTYNQIGN
jgi:hypothetical protein